jgi:hypothetical protein
MRKLFAAVVLSAAALSADVVIGTGVPGSIEGNSLNGLNVTTWPAEAWHGPIGDSKWESFQANTLNPPVPDGTLVNFWFRFTYSNPALPEGTLSVMVDDSARGVLNGHTLFDNLKSPSGVACAESLPNCREPLVLNITPDLVRGTNVLAIEVSQDARYTYGLDVYGVIRPDPVPETSFFADFACGLSALLLARRLIAA